MVYRRLEFIFDIGQGPRVLAFVDFSQHISFGIPTCYQFNDFTIEQLSENYERITIHKDGTIRTHYPLAQKLPALWDGQFTPLSSWDTVWCMKEELYWGSQYPQSIRNYLAKPKINRQDTYLLRLSFPPQVEETVVVFSILHSLNIDIKQVPIEIRRPGFCTWVLVDSWPYVLVSIANLGIFKPCTQLKSVGRDYQA